MMLALAGGVGGAKLALGLSRILEPTELRIIVNTGDDFTHVGLQICPDLDTVMYTLAGIANPQTGWGIDGESWNFMQAIQRLGGESWFQLGDRDLATHVERTRRLAQGETLSDVTRDLSQRLGVRHLIVPMSDAPVSSMVLSNGTRLAFQDYFVREKTQPIFSGIEYQGAESAPLSPNLANVLEDANLDGVVICPSNPYLSIGPMLAMPDLRRWFENRTCKVVAVSPIIAGQAVKGPAAKILRELGLDVSPISIAAYYEGLIDYLVIDEADASVANDVTHFGISPIVAPILMQSIDDREKVASVCITCLKNG
jgi:LPPG:FO 2-phospho-L-lactate transferase